MGALQGCRKLGRLVHVLNEREICEVWRIPVTMAIGQPTSKPICPTPVAVRLDKHYYQGPQYRVPSRHIRSWNQLRCVPQVRDTMAEFDSGSALCRSTVLPTDPKG